MAPTILVVGATGNTGRGVVESLPGLIEKSSHFKDHRILGLTRSKPSVAAQETGKLSHVELAEQNWVEIDSDWLRQHEVVRIFIASHNQPNQFAEEGQFLVEALRAGIEYVVRISTTAANVTPAYPAYYPRTHWAIEAMLGQPEFRELKWTSLQPNVFTNFVLSPAAAFIKEFRKMGKQGTLSLILNSNAPVGVVEPREVGAFAARLLASEDISKHDQKKYVLNGPEDLTGERVVKMVEGYIGEKVQDVRFKDMSFLDQMADAETVQSKNVIRSIKYAPVTAWEGKASVSTTSKEVLELVPPRCTPVKVLEMLLQS